MEVFEGNTGDPKTLAAQIEKLKRRFKLDRVVLVSDRGMITEARIRQEFEPAGLDWITALRAPAIQLWRPTAARCRCRYSMSAIWPKSVRLIFRANGWWSAATVNGRRTCEKAPRAPGCHGERPRPHQGGRGPQTRSPTRTGQNRHGGGAVIGKRKMAKHFELTIEDASSTFRRKEDEIAAEARLDGLYDPHQPAQRGDGGGDAINAYKSLSQVERAFRSLKTVDLEIRPIHHWLSDRVRAHVFLCMLAYYVEWHMHQKLAPMLFDDEDKEAALASRRSPVAKAPRSDRAKAKDAGKRTEDGLPVRSFHTRSPISARCASMRPPP